MYHHTNDKAKRLAERSIKSLNDFELPIAPLYFSLFYAYYSGEHPDVSKAIDAYLEAGRPITEERCKNIYNKILEQTSATSTIVDASDQLSDITNNLLDFVNEASEGNQNFTSHLDDFAKKLDTDNSQEDMATMVQTMMEQSRETMVRQWDLEKQLATASEQITTLKTELEDVNADARTDPLTQLANRRAFNEFIQTASEEASKNDTSMTLVIGDVDNFKAFNDKWGHSFGDQVLKLVAHSITEHTPTDCLASRYGGEEFAIVLPGHDLATAREIADKAREFISSKVIRRKDSSKNVGQITISFGVAIYEAGECIPHFIERADMALYSAKEQGRDRVVCAPIGKNIITAVA